MLEFSAARRVGGFKGQLYTEFIRRVKSQGSDSSPGVGRMWVRAGTCDVWRESRPSRVACGPGGRWAGARVKVLGRRCRGGSGSGALWPHTARCTLE